MGKTIFIILATLLFIMPTLELYSQGLSCQYLIDLGKKEMDQGNLERALHYFKLAQITAPQSEEVLFYINLIKRKKEGRVEEIPLTEKAAPQKQKIRKPKLKKRALKKTLTVLEKTAVKKGTESKQEEKIKQPAIKTESVLTTKVEKKDIPLKPRIIKTAEKTPPKAQTEPPGQRINVGTLHLTDELFAVQPKTLVEIYIGEDLIVESSSIKRWLVIDPRIIEVKRIDDKKIRIVTKQIGTTFLHLWEQDRRWTFNVKVGPKITVVPEKEKDTGLYEVAPFKFYYNADWRSYYSGRRLGVMTKQSSTFEESMGFYGDTPYGKMDGSLRASKQNEHFKVNNYTLGLADGKFGDFEDFNIRVFDIYEPGIGYTGFSELSYPGKLLRGASLKADAFDKNLRYSVVWGKEKEGMYGFITPGIRQDRDSYVEGIKMTFLPLAKSNYSVNFAHGYGDEREEFLRENVYSFETTHNYDRLHFSSEIACDEYSLAGFFNSSLKLDKIKLRLGFRDIEKNFTTITGRPANRGEIGAVAGMDWQITEKTDFSTEVDVYRDRFSFKEEDKHKMNYDGKASLTIAIDPDSRFTSRLYYSYEPGLSFPRRYCNITNTYFKRHKVFNNRTLSTTFGAGYQRSRNPLSSTSDYDVYSLSSDLRLNLTDDLYYYFNYNYNWLEERLSRESSSPSVWETGIGFNKNLRPDLTGDLRFYFRNEEDTTSTHSFLAGEDSIEGALRLTYTPKEDMEVFVDGRVRNVWAENFDSDKYIEAEIRLGVRCSFDTLFRWNPKGKVHGYVFKDTDNDGEKDRGEPFIKDVKIRIGNKQLTSDEDGNFSTDVAAKKVLAKIEPETLPEGYVLTTPSLSEIDIQHGEENFIIFGATTSSSIHGIIYHDANSNKKFDSQEKTFPKVKLILDGKKILSDPNGRYFFRRLQEGNYTITLDVNSIPIDYLPSVPIKKEISLREGINYIYNIPLKKKE